MVMSKAILTVWFHLIKDGAAVWSGLPSLCYGALPGKSKKKGDQAVSSHVCTKIYTTWLMTGGAHWLMDTIEYQGRFWLVPAWLDRRSAGWTRPLRIVWLATGQHKRTKVNDQADFLVEEPIPKAVFDGRIPSQLTGKVAVIEAPDIKVYFPAGVH
jgi:hypothetical protein